MHNTQARSVAVVALAGILLGSASCGRDVSADSGTVVVSIAGDADGLFPPTARQLVSRQVTDLLFDKLANIGPDLITVGDSDWTPRLARSWSWSKDSMAVTFHLDARARWQDGAPVRAKDVRFAFQVYTDPAVGAADGGAMTSAVDSLTVADSVDCTAWFRTRSPERFYTLVYSLVPLPEHLLGKLPRDSLRVSPFGRLPIGDGPYHLVRWDAGQRLEIATADSYYGPRPSVSRVIWTITSEGQTAAQRVFAGEADFIETLTPPEVADVAKHPDIVPVRLRGIAYAYLLFNLRDGASSRPHPLLADRALRRALTMALDRRAIVSNLLDTLGGVADGPFTRGQWSADTTLAQVPFDPVGAARALDSLGWRGAPGGTRSRDGKPLAFSLLVPASSQARQRLAVLLQEQWRQVGVHLDVERMDLAAMNARMTTHRFDAVLMQIATSPSPAGLRQAWSTAAITMANGFNLGRYSSPRVDTLIDGALAATTVASARTQYRAAYQALLDDAPAIWLFEPAVIAAVNRRVTLDGLRRDAWWMSLPAWHVSGRGPQAATTHSP